MRSVIVVHCCFDDTLHTDTHALEHTANTILNCSAQFGLLQSSHTKFRVVVKSKSLDAKRHKQQKHHRVYDYCKLI